MGTGEAVGQGEAKAGAGGEAGVDAVVRDSRDSRYLYEAHAKVKRIGTGWRWYDIPYRILHVVYYSRFGKLLPRKVRAYFYYGLNYLLPFSEHDRHLVWDRADPLHNLDVPDGEHVSIPGLWVVELFPPSELDNLTAAIERYSWDRKRVWVGLGEANREILERSRTGTGRTWWRLAQIAGENSRYIFPDRHRQRLPGQFDAIELVAVRLGTGLTAVLTYFHLSSAAARVVDEVWHADHEPQIVYGKGRPQAEDRMWTALRKTQQGRRSLHDAARKWLAEVCPGAFANSSEQQPLMDLLLMGKHDPSLGEEPDRWFSEALRALGVTEAALLRTSADLPGLLLEPVSQTLCPALEGKHTWTLWGQRDAVAAKIEHLYAYGTNKDHAIAHVVHDRMRDFLALLAISELLKLMEQKYSALRDEARIRHGSYTTKHLKHLRANFLTLSLDLTSVARDIRAFHNRNRRYDEEARFMLDHAPWLVRSGEQAGFERFKPIDMNEDLKGRQSTWCAELIAADKDYRDILTTVATLGASIDTWKVSRIAIWIALVSMAVALVTLLVSNIEPNAPLSAIVRWITSLKSTN